MKKKHRVVPPTGKTDPEYHRLWRIVDGAVKDALDHHPDYLSATARHKVVRNSINKRVVGAVKASLRKQQGLT